MSEETKPQLTEEEMIEKKVKFRRMLSQILMAVGTILIIIFIVLIFLTRENIDVQTSINTQELRSKLKNIVALQKRYYEENGEYIQIKYLSLQKALQRYDPKIDGDFKYKFDPETEIATGIERDASHDVNGDADGNDGLTLSVNWEAGKTEESDFFWTDEDLSDFESRATQTEQ